MDKLGIYNLASTIAYPELQEEEMMSHHEPDQDSPRQVNLQSGQTDNTFFTIDAEVTQEGNVVVSSFDLGAGPKAFFGSSESEHYVTVKAPHVPSMLLHLMSERFKSEYEYKEWLTERGIPYETFTWIPTNWDD